MNFVYARAAFFSLLLASAIALSGCGSTSAEIVRVEEESVTPPNFSVLATSGAGTAVADTLATFRTFLGDPANGANAGPLAAGHRQINWDGVPGGVTNVDNFAGDFFNVNSPRGLVMSTNGTGFRVSDNDFSDVNPSYAAQFADFSPVRIFSPIGSNVLDIVFLVPGSQTPATVSGFGVVFSDVDLPDSTSVEYFDNNGQSLGRFFAPVQSGSNHSFLGVNYNNGLRVARVRITSGAAAIGAGVNDVTAGGAFDLVVMDDFIYGEPQATAQVVVSGSGDVASDLESLRRLLGAPLNGVAVGPLASGHRQVNWDGVPGGQTNTNTFPGAFFNTNSPRGLNMTTPGTGFRVSDNNFSDLNAEYAAGFNFFSTPRTFAAVGSNFIDLDFLVPGSATASAVNGFGAVFSDVDVPGGSSVEFFNGNTSLGVFGVPVRSDARGLSFLGGRFTQPVTRVRLTVGQAPLGPGVSDISAGGPADLVILDDFLYGEPNL